MQDNPLDHLVKILSRLPGLGQKSARRIALHLLTNKDSALKQLITALDNTEKSIEICDICGNFDTHTPCRICSDTRRDNKKICIISNVADLWAIERTRTYTGQYHVLGGLLSALNGVTPDDLSIKELLERIRHDEPEEIILALSATVDGQSTSHYISDHCKEFPDLKITKLAHGVPIGGELDYLDDGTITTAMRARDRLL